jgi:hypothetical protein
MKTKPRSAETAAAELLRRHGVTRPPVDVEALARGEGAEVQFERLEPSVSGLLVKTPKGQVRIGVNASHHRNRQRFTISHEMGHYLLHSQQPTLFVDGQMVYFREDAASDAFDPREIQANAFAAGLLMPEDFLRADLKNGIDVQDEVAVRKLAERYQVSQQALTLRLLNLGLIAGLATPANVRRR